MFLKKKNKETYQLKHGYFVVVVVLIFEFLSLFCIPDVDECTIEVSDCDINADCTNTEGSYNCICNPDLLEMAPIAQVGYCIYLSIVLTSGIAFKYCLTNVIIKFRYNARCDWLKELAFSEYRARSLKADQFLFLLRHFDEFEPKINVFFGSDKRKENELFVCSKHELPGGHC